MSISRPIISGESKMPFEGPPCMCLGTSWAARPTPVGLAKLAVEHQAAGRVPCKAAPFAELPNTQILPDLASFQEASEMLEWEHSLDGWEFLCAWLETAAAWLTWRQSVVPCFCVTSAMAAPCTPLIQAGKGAEGKRASRGLGQNQARQDWRGWG